MMMTQFNERAILLFLTALATASLVAANAITVGNPGAGVTVLTMEAVPNVLGDAWDEDPPITVASEVPVQVLRYSDYPEFFLEGGQPLYPSQVYVVVKSDCGDDASLIPQIDYVTENRTNEWDSNEYTTLIEITFPSAEQKDLDTETFLDASVFNATWAYGSFWCQAQQATEAPTAVPKRTRPPVDTTADEGGDTIPPQDPADTTPEKTAVGDEVELSDPTAPESGTPIAATAQKESASSPSAKSLIGIMVALLSSVCLMVGLGSSGDHRSGKSNCMITVLVVMIAMLMATSSSTIITQAESPAANAKTTSINSAAAAVKEIPRKLQQCAVTVEILIDGCRRVHGGSDIADLEIIAPAVRVMDGEVQDMISWANAEDACLTNYTANLAFNATLEGGDSSVERQQRPPVVSVGSFSSDLQQYGGCFRAVEGRPFIDSEGRHVHSKAVLESNENAAWSASIKDAAAFSERDEALGRQWLDRAVGEHASVPAFAAFTIALMSNNAPPELVQDALAAAQDEVRHAKTSFEVASLLLGETVEPGPLPPSSLSFGQDIKSLALATAKEGCVDETLSALVACLEVDFEIDQNTIISKETKEILKDKMRTIALEETNHSGLAWRTVRWACSVDEDACSAVHKEVLQNEYFEVAFAKRFAHLDGHIVSVARQVWDEIYTTMTPIVLPGRSEVPEMRVADGAVVVPSLPCLEDTGLDRYDSLLEEMGKRIMSHLSCSRS